MLGYDEAMQLADMNKDEAKGLRVKFYSKAVLNQAKTDKAKREIYDDIDYIIIDPLVDKRTIYNQPATDNHKRRFPRHWEAYQNGKELAVTGLPVGKWQGISRARAEEYISMGIQTVEQISEIENPKAYGATTSEEIKRARKLLSPDNAMEAMKMQNETLQKQVEDMAAEMAKLKTKDENNVTDGHNQGTPGETERTDTAVVGQPRKRGRPKGS